METSEATSHRLSHAEREERRHRRHLLCEWCNKWTRVSRKLWWSIAYNYRNEALPAEEVLYNRRQLVFFCSRERCVTNRPDEYVPGIWNP